MSKFYTSVEKVGNNILWNGYENGKRFNRKIPFQPTLFIPTKDENSKYKSLIGSYPIKPRKFENMTEARDFVEKYKDVSGFSIYGTGDFVTQFIQEQYPGEIDYDVSDIHFVYYDIEVDISEKLPDTETADCPIISISYKSSKTDKFYLLGQKDYDSSKTTTKIDPANIIFEKFKDEVSLLRRFIQLWTSDFPDIVSGWNVTYFDVMYTVTRIIRVLGEGEAKRLSPWGIIRKKTATKFNKPASTYQLMGIAVVDMMDALKKFGYKYGPQESYKLDHIAYVIVGEKKIDYSQYGSLTELYLKDPQLYLDYSLKDTYLVEAIEKEAALLSLVADMAYRGGVNYNDTFGTVGIWESTLYRWQLSRNIVPPVKRGPGEEGGALVGGYVKDPKVGFSDWVVTGDFSSLYPHLMLQYNMSPETYTEEMRKFCTPDMVLNGEFESNDPEYAYACNGVAFKKTTRGMIPTIIEEYYAERKAVKNKMLAEESELELIKEEMNKRGIEYH